jgi:uncharacterized protein (TIGR03382 family)
MYNMFLGIRAATESDDHGCAVAVLEATRDGATAWNRSHEDPDIAADVTLIDQYLANLRARGVDGERTLSTCPAAGDPYGPPIGVDPLPIDEVDHYPRRYACSAGGASGGLPIMVGALLAVGLRRRRR